VATKKIEEMDVKLFDVRTVKRYVEKGVITMDQVKKAHEILPDSESKAALCEVKQDEVLAESERRRVTRPAPVAVSVRHIRREEDQERE